VPIKRRRPGGESRGDEAGILPSDQLGEPLNCTTEGQLLEPPTLAEVLAELVKIRWALELQARPRVEPLGYRLDQLAEALGSSPRLIQKEVSAGRFPRPVKIGRVSVWPVEVLREFLAQQQAAGGRRGVR
jgi:predicted DNA-binding transcriptional regulator AlpA